MPRAGLTALLCALALGGVMAPSAQAYPHGDRVVIAFFPAKGRNPNLPSAVVKKLASLNEIFYKRLQNRPQLALGLLNPTQGSYSEVQTYLDMTQGTRVSTSTYSPKDVPRPRLLVKPDGSGYILRWGYTLARANSAPAEIHPGLMAGSVPGGAAYVGPARSDSRNRESVVAADQSGRIASASLGTPGSVAARAQRELRTHRLVVAGLPQKRAGGRELDKLLAARRPGELVIVSQTPPDFHRTQLLGIGVAGMGDTNSLTSATTRRSNMVTAIDFAPTVLKYLGLSIPDTIRGEPITTTGTRPSAAQLDNFRNRLEDLGKRRIPTLELMLLAWLGVVFVLGALGGWHATRRRALRVGALAMMWIPVMVLFTAIVQPRTAIGEAGVIALCCFAAGAVTDRVLPWPRGPAIPAAVTLFAYAFDMFRNSNVLVRSLLGPNPRFGSRFYGIGNELEIILTIVLLMGVAAALSYAERSRRNAALFAGAGVVIGIVICSGRFGADVGGAFTVGSGVAVATLVMLPGRPSRRAIALAIVSPLIALALLAGLDLVSGGNSHFTRSVLHAHSFAEVKDVFLRRYELAFGNLVRGRTPAIVLAGGLAIAFGWRNRRWLLAPLDVPAWRAALLGSIAASIIGSATNDSGPLMFIIGVFVLGFIVAYVQGDPRLARDAARVPPTAPTKLGQRLADNAALYPRSDALPAVEPARTPTPAPVP